MSKELKREFVLLFICLLVIGWLCHELYFRIEEIKSNYFIANFLTYRMHYFENQWQACEALLSTSCKE